jgi:hypothetical protein
MLSTVKQVDAEVLKTLQTQVCWHDWEIELKNEQHAAMVRVSEKFKEKMNAKNQSAEYYRDKRNARSPLGDITIGKFGEFVACFALRSIGFPKIMPDISIRKGSRKGWDCDLPFGELDTSFFNSHVKTCDQNTSDYVSRVRGDQYTWTFQWANRTGFGGRDKLFDRQNSSEVIWFMFVPNLDSKTPRLIASAPWNKLQGILKDPLSEKLKGLKKCVYSDDLLSLSNAEI